MKGEIIMSDDLAMQELKRRVQNKGSQQAVAEELEITPAYLSDILKGRRDLSDNILFKLGFVKISLHVKTKQAPQVIKAIEKELTTQL